MEIIQLLISILGNTELGVVSSILTMPILVYVVRNQMRIINLDKRQDEGLRTLLQCKIVEIHDMVIEFKNDPHLADDNVLEAFEECYTQYKQLGGNGFADRMKRDIDVIRDKKIAR